MPATRQRIRNDWINGLIGFPLLLGFRDEMDQQKRVSCGSDNSGKGRKIQIGMAYLFN
jgi:hypothetical protein